MRHISTEPTTTRRVRLIEAGRTVGYTTRLLALAMLRRQYRDEPDIVGDGALGAVDIDTGESVRS